MKFKIKLATGRESIGSGESPALPKIVLKNNGGTAGAPATSSKEGDRSNAGRGANAPSVSQGRGEKAPDFPDHDRVSDFRLAAFDQVSADPRRLPPTCRFSLSLSHSLPIH